jgi:tetratricopeptide (TPR) repeat protein
MINFQRKEMRQKLLTELIEHIEKGENPSLIDSTLLQTREQYLVETTEYLLAYKDFLDKKFPAALTHLEEAIKLDPTLVLAHILKGSVLIHMGEFEKAIQSINYSIENLMLMNYAVFFLNKGVAFDRLGRNDEAISCFLRAIEDNSKDEKSYRNCLIVMAKKKDWFNFLSLSENIREVFKENITFINDTISQLLETARIISKEGNPGIAEKFLEEAEKQLDVAVKTKPEDIGILYNLACFYARRNKEPEAIETLKKAFENMESDEIKKKYREWANIDMDLANIRENPQFKEIV